MAHELRNALTPLMMGLPILKEAADVGADARRVHEMYERQIDHMNRLVSDLLDMARSDHGKMRIERRRTDLNELARSIVDDHRSQFEQRGIILRSAFAESPIYVMADSFRLAQVLSNLLQNAAKFTDRNGIVSIVVAEQGGQALVGVRDTGIGMTAETIPRLFAPFVQCETALKHNRSGLGLGLALVKTLVELHGGTVDAASDGIGQGAEFSVRLPLLGKARASSPVRTAPPSERRAQLSVA